MLLVDNKLFLSQPRRWEGIRRMNRAVPSKAKGAVKRCYAACQSNWFLGMSYLQLDRRRYTGEVLTSGKDFISPCDDTSAVCQPCGRVKDGVFDYQPLEVYYNGMPVCVENGSHCHGYVCGTSGLCYTSLHREIIKWLWRQPPCPPIIEAEANTK